MRKIIFVIMTAWAIFISGCATTGTLDDTWKKAPGRLKEEVINYSFDKTYDATKMAILNIGLALDSEGKKDNTTMLYAKSTANMAKVIFFGTGYGEMVGIYLTPLSETQTKLEVAVEKTYKLDVGYKDYRGLIINQIKTILELKNKNIT